MSKVTDPVLLKELVRQGINPDDVDFDQDYAPRSQGKRHGPYSKFYTTKSGHAKGKQFMVISALPMVDALGNKNVAGWDDNGSLKNPRYTEKNNLFKASADGTKVVLQVKNDQPDGRKQGDKLTYQAQLYLDNLEALPASTDATRLPVDPQNANYTNNVLEWDYGICKRRLRLIEGRVLGSWMFASKPAGEVRIKYNQIGDYRLRLGQFKVNDDEEVVKSEDFDQLAELKGYPVTVNDSATYYPDAHAESTSVDGRAYQEYDATTGDTWATMIAAAGSTGNDTDVNYNGVYIATSNTLWRFLTRSIMLFDVSGLPDDPTVSAATLSLYGNAKNDNLSCTPDLNVYSSAPASNTAIAAGDYDSLGSSVYCDTAITYANWITADPFWNDFAFNATGIAAVKAAAVGNTVVKLGCRNANYDVGATEPNWITATSSTLQAYFSDQGAGYKPKLVVTYTAGNIAVTPTTLAIALTLYAPVLAFTVTPTTLALTITTYAPEVVTARLHTFWSKSYRNKLVIPNYVTVSSIVGDSPAYTGYATDPSYSLIRRDAFADARLESNAQATSIAKAIIAQAQLSAEGGAGLVSNNVGAEVFDWVKITDVRQGDTKLGSTGFIHRKINFQKNKWHMDFGFGGWLQRQGFSQSLVTGILGWEIGNAAITNPMTSILTNVGDTLLHSNAATASTTSATYVKKKEVQITSWGYLRIKITLTSNDPDELVAVYGRIYKKINGVDTAIGTERVSYTFGSVTFSEDFDHLKPGDLIQVYIHSNGFQNQSLDGFAFYWDTTGQTNPYTPTYINILT